jgi:hypothetical protein
MYNPTPRRGVPRRPILDRIMEKVEKTPDGCWRWTASRSAPGYARIGSGGQGGAPLLAHRVMYELQVAPIPDGLEIDHLCGHRDCVNPAHLEAVSHAENMARIVWAPRDLSTHCVHGHEYTPENTAWKRECKTCARAHRRKRRRGKK